MKPRKEVLTALLICAEMNTPLGAIRKLPDWAKKANGDPDYHTIAFEGRVLEAKLYKPKKTGGRQLARART